MTNKRVVYSNVNLRCLIAQTARLTLESKIKSGGAKC